MLALLAACGRLYIRLRIQKRRSLSLDDAFLLPAVVGMITVHALSLAQMDNMFLVDALTFDPLHVPFTADTLQRVYDFQVVCAVAQAFSQLTIACVKLSFLFLFRQLISRVPYMRLYWWFTTIFNLAVIAAGIIGAFALCPHYLTFAALTCASGPTAALTRKFGIPQMTLDAVGDLLILVIPVYLIYKIRVDLRQKITLSFSLCLTVFIVAVTVVRPAGLYDGNSLRVVWGAFWMFVSVDVGVALASLTAFRTLFVRRGSAASRSPKHHFDWYQHRRWLRFPWSWRRTTDEGYSHEKRGFGPEGEKERQLPSIPGATLTGMRTFIGRRGRTTVGASQTLNTLATHEGREAVSEDPWLLPGVKPKAWVDVERVPDANWCGSGKSHKIILR